MMLQIKFGCNRPAGLGDIHVWKCGRMDARTDGRTTARVPSYKLTLWAFGSGELKTSPRNLPAFHIHKPPPETSLPFTITHLPQKPPCLLQSRTSQPFTITNLPAFHNHKSPCLSQSQTSLPFTITNLPQKPPCLSQSQTSPSLPQLQTFPRNLPAFHNHKPPPETSMPFTITNLPQKAPCLSQTQTSHRNFPAFHNHKPPQAFHNHKPSCLSQSQISLPFTNLPEKPPCLSQSQHG